MLPNPNEINIKPFSTIKYELNFPTIEESFHNSRNESVKTVAFKNISASRHLKPTQSINQAGSLTLLHGQGHGISENQHTVVREHHLTTTAVSNSTATSALPSGRQHNQLAMTSLHTGGSLTPLTRDPYPSPALRATTVRGNTTPGSKNRQSQSTTTTYTTQQETADHNLKNRKEKDGVRCKQDERGPCSDRNGEEEQDDDEVENNNNSTTAREDNILTQAQTEELSYLIDSHTEKLGKRNFNYRSLIKTNRRETNDFLQDIHDIIFNSSTKRFPTLTLKVALEHSKTDRNECVAVLDTGSNHDILNSKLVGDIKLDTENLPSIVAANGKPINIIGKAILSLKIGHSRFLTEFLVVEGLSTDLILGNKFMMTHGIEILYTKRQVIIHKEGKKEVFPMDVNWVLSLIPQALASNEINNSELEEVRASTEIVVNGRQHYKMAELNQKFATFDFEIDKNFRDKKKMHAYLATDEKGKLTVVLYNPGRVSKWIKSSALIGHLRPTETPQTPKIMDEFILKSSYGKGKIIVRDKNGDELNINPKLSVEDHNKVANMLKKYSHMFTNKVEDLTPSDVPPARIKLKDNADPVNVPPYRQSLKERQLLDAELDKLLEVGVMQEAEDYCSWASPIFYHRNSDGSARIITDFRSLNEKIEKQSWPLPSIDQVLSCLSGNNWFCRLDLKQSFHQITVDERDRKYLTVTSPTRKLTYKVLPQGLCVSSVIFQRQMVKILSKHLYLRVIPYIDDLPIIGTNQSEQLRNTEIILQELDKFKLKLNTKKSLFMYEQMEILGHEVSAEGCRPLQSSVEAIKALRLPKTIKAVRSLLGSFNFFRAFIPNFAKTALPITNLIKEYNKTKIINWTDECTQSVNELKNLLISKPLLSHFRDDRQSIIYCDASQLSIGAALLQIDPNTGIQHPVCYLSRKLRDNEINHSVSDKEMTALAYACCKWREYLIGRKVICYTDHQSLTFLKSFKGHSSRLSRLAMTLSDFDLDVRYKPGKLMDLPDLLSRHPEDKYIEEDVLAAIQDVNSLVQIDLSNEQKSDPELKLIIDVLSQPDPKSKDYLKHSMSYMLRDNILYKKIFIGEMYKYVIVVPKSLQQELLKEFHDSPISGGHLNAVKVLNNLKTRYFWKDMPTQTFNYVRSCLSCQRRKIPPRKNYGPLQPIPIASRPFERIQLDVLGPLCASNKFRYILTVTDSHSRMAFAFNLVHADAKSLSNCLLKLFFVYGTPFVVQSDLGTENKNALFTCLNTALGSCQIFSSAYVPRINGQVERFNGILVNLLSHYCNDKPNTWSNYVDKVVFCYNNSVHHVLKEKPSFLFLGYNVQLPSDTLIALPHTDRELLNRLQTLEEVRKALPALIKKEQGKQAKYHDRYRTNIELQSGDEVLVSYPYNLREPMSKFSYVYKGPYTVLHKLSPVSYNVEILKNGRLVPENIHISRIKLYYRRE